MDISKERDAFEKKFPVPAHWIDFDGLKCKYICKYNAIDDVTLKYQARWEAWQVAKAQAVPEGFVLIKESERDREIFELIDQRENMERLADQLKDKLQDLYRVDFGEYTSCNCPLKNAIEYDDSNLVLVPREPTEEMLGAAWEAPPAGGPSGNRRVFYEKQAVVYKAMVEEAEKEMTEAREPAND